jgi:hypothetical protein
MESGQGVTAMMILYYRAQDAGYVRFEIQERHNGQFPFVTRYITGKGKTFLKDLLGF